MMSTPSCEHTITKDVALRELGLFSGSSRRQLRAISRCTTDLDLCAGTRVCREGVTPPQFVIVIDSAVDLYRAGDYVGTVYAGGWFGHDALLDGRRTEDVTAVAREGSRLFVYSELEFESVLHIAPRVADLLGESTRPGATSVSSSTGAGAPCGSYSAMVLTSTSARPHMGARHPVAGPRHRARKRASTA